MKGKRASANDGRELHDMPKARQRAKAAAAQASGVTEIPKDMRIVGDRVMVRFVGDKLRKLPGGENVIDAQFEMGVNQEVADRFGAALRDPFAAMRHKGSRITHIQLSELAIENQNVEFFLVPDAASGGADLAITDIPFTKFRLVRDKGGDVDIKMKFLMTVPVGSSSATLERWYKNDMWLRLEAAQGNLFEKAS